MSHTLRISTPRGAITVDVDSDMLLVVNDSGVVTLIFDGNPILADDALDTTETAAPAPCGEQHSWPEGWWIGRHDGPTTRDTKTYRLCTRTACRAQQESTVGRTHHWTDENEDTGALIGVHNPVWTTWHAMSDSDPDPTYTRYCTRSRCQETQYGRLADIQAQGLTPCP